MLSLLSPRGEQARAAALARSGVLLGCLLCLAAAQSPQAAESRPAANISAAQIVARNIAARGGEHAWHAVQTLSLSGKLEAGNGDSIARAQAIAHRETRPGRHGQAAGQAADDKTPASPQVELPFKLEMKRPHNSRLEIEFAGKTAVQVYDGKSGWKLRPYLNRNDAEPFTAEEAKLETAKADLDGPLVDYAVKGTKIQLDGVERVAGHDAYKLKLTLKNGDVQHVWIDAQSFLDVKLEGIPRRMDGKMHNVWVYQSDFRSVQGLLIPFVYESAVDGYPQTHKMTVQNAIVNAPMDDSRFGKPQPLVAQGSPRTAHSGN